METTVALYDITQANSGICSKSWEVRHDKLQDPVSNIIDDTNATGSVFLIRILLINTH